MTDRPDPEAGPDPISDDPILLTDFLQLLSVRGKVGQLRVANIILPTVSLGDVASPSINVRTPAFRSTDIFSNGVVVAPAAGVSLASTGALTGGTYDVILTMNGAGITNRTAFVWEHRNAANTATLAAMSFTSTPSSARLQINYQLVFGYEVALDERMRIITDRAYVASEEAACVIFARLRT